jgi:hypothetical protein
MAKVKGQWGGSRPNSGAKKISPKVPITLYLHPEEIERMGGRDDTRFMFYSYWMQELQLPNDYYNTKKH